MSHVFCALAVSGSEVSDTDTRHGVFDVFPQEAVLRETSRDKNTNIKISPFTVSFG